MAQALEIGVSRHAVDGHLRAGRWRPLLRGTYYTLDTEPGHLAWLWAVQLRAPAAAANGRSAGWLLGLEGCKEPPPTVEVLLPRAQRSVSIDRATVASSRHIPASDVMRVAGIRTTRVERTLVDVAEVMPEARLMAAVLDALRKRLTTRSLLAWRATRLTRGGRCGPGRVLDLLDGLDPRAELRASPLEDRLRDVILGTPLPEPKYQQRVRTIEGDRYFDAAWPEVRLGVEADGWDAHHTAAQLSRDAQQQNSLILLDWTLLRYTHGDLTQRRDEVAMELTAAYYLCRQHVRGALRPTPR